MEDFLFASDSINVTVFHLINGINNPQFKEAMVFLSLIGKHLLFPVYFLLFLAMAFIETKKIQGLATKQYYLDYTRTIKKTALLLVISYLIYLAWVTGLKHVFHLPRPFIRLPEGSVLIMDKVRNAENPNVSFPSGHCAFAMMMLACLWRVLNSFGKFIGIFLVLWIGISRIALGVHFPSDVLISWILSLIVVSLTIKLLTPVFTKLFNTDEKIRNM